MERAASGSLGEEKIMVLFVPGVHRKARTRVTFLQTLNGSLAFLASIATFRIRMEVVPTWFLERKSFWVFTFK